MIEVELPDGRIVEFPEGMSREDIRAALRKLDGPAAPTLAYGEAPEGYVMNPFTGQMTSREELANHMLQQGQTRGMSALSGGARGVSFGGVDELTGGLQAAIPGPGTPQERYAFGREHVRAMEDAARDQNPVTFGASEIGGGAATALGYAVPAMAGRGLLGAAATGAGVGAAEGAGFGFLSGEGGAAERAQNAVGFGLLGGAVGAAAPYAIAAGGAALRSASDPVAGAVASLRNTARRGRANRALAATLERSGRSIDEIDNALALAAREGQPEYRVADAMGIAGQRRLSGLTRSGGDGATEIRQFLDQRQIDQPERVAGFIADAFDVERTAEATREALRASRKAAADINYSEARKGARPVNLNAAIGVIDDALMRDPILGETALRQTEIGRRLAALRGQMQAGGEQLIDFDRVLNIKEDLGAQIRNMRSVPPQIAQVYNRLDTALEAASEGYRRANDQFRRTSQLIDAVDTGAAMSRPSARSADTTAQFQQMRPGEQRAARIGYGDNLLRQTEGAVGGANRARPLTSSKRAQEAATMARDPEVYQRQIGREMDMFETRNIATGGSRTADNLADIEDMAGYDAGIISSIMRGNFAEAGIQAGSRAGNALTGMNEATRKRIADALLSQNTRALTEAIQEINEPQTQRVVWNAILRSGALRIGERAQGALTAQ